MGTRSASASEELRVNGQRTASCGAEYQKGGKNLTQELDTEGVPVTEEGSESSVLNGVRKELREAKAELKSRPDRDELRAELKAELAGDTAIETLLEGFGHPKGILETIKGKLGDGEATVETVAAALTSIGYKVDVEGAASSEEVVKEDDPATELAKVSQLSAEVQATAKGKTTVDVTEQIAAANTEGEVNAIMAKAGLLEDYGH